VSKDRFYDRAKKRALKRSVQAMAILQIQRAAKKQVSTDGGRLTGSRGRAGVKNKIEQENKEVGFYNHQLRHGCPSRGK
jgi:hypothetical protein